MDLAEWTVHFVKNKDMMHKKLQNFKVKEGSIHFQFKDKSHDYVLKEILDSEILDLEADADFLTIVSKAKLSNLQFLIENWSKLSKKNFVIILVRVETNDKMIINPYTHSMIADPETLEMGLKSMYEHAIPD